MNLRCAWCNEVYGTKEAQTAKTSHGACPTCKELFLSKLRKRDEQIAGVKVKRPSQLKSP